MFDDFDIQIQCEELGSEGLRAQLQWQDYFNKTDAPRVLRRYRDVMDYCEIVPLHTIKNYRSHGHMEDYIPEEIDFADLWDVPFNYEEIVAKTGRFPG